MCQHCNSFAYGPQADSDKTVNWKAFSLFNLNRKVLKSVNELCLHYQGKQFSQHTSSKLQLFYMQDSWHPTGALHFFLGNNYMCFRYFPYSALTSDSREFVFPCPKWPIAATTN